MKQTSFVNISSTFLKLCFFSKQNNFITLAKCDFKNCHHFLKNENFLFLFQNPKAVYYFVAFLEMPQRSIYPVTSQTYPFRQVLWSYIDKNCTPRAHFNLIQTCKCFFERHRMIVMENLIVTKLYDEEREDYRDDEWVYQEHHLVKNDVIYSLVDKKLWLTKSLRLKNGNLIPSLITSIYRYDVSELSIDNCGDYEVLFDSDISMDDIRFICTKNIKSFWVSRFLVSIYFFGLQI